MQLGLNCRLRVGSSQRTFPTLSHAISIKTRAFEWPQPNLQQFHLFNFDDVKFGMVKVNNFVHENVPDDLTKTSVAVAYPGRDKAKNEQNIRYIYRSTFSRFPIGIQPFRKRAHSADGTQHWLSKTKTSHRELQLSPLPNLTIDWSVGQQHSQTLPTASKFHFRTCVSMTHTPTSPNTLSLDDSLLITESEQLDQKKETVSEDWRDEIGPGKAMTRTPSSTSIPDEKRLEWLLARKSRYPVYPYSQPRPFEVKIIPKLGGILAFHKGKCK